MLTFRWSAPVASIEEQFLFSISSAYFIFLPIMFLCLQQKLLFFWLMLALSLRLYLKPSTYLCFSLLSPPLSLPSRSLFLSLLSFCATFAVCPSLTSLSNPVGFFFFYVRVLRSLADSPRSPPCPLFFYSEAFLSLFSSISVSFSVSQTRSIFHYYWSTSMLYAETWSQPMPQLPDHISYLNVKFMTKTSLCTL